MVKQGDLNIDLIKQKINSLVGSKVDMEIMKGRKKAKKISGVVECTYPQVFVVNITEGLTGLSKFSCAYSDVLCGNVTLEETNEA